MTDDELRATVAEVAHEELKWEGPLPEGDLGAHLDSVQRLTLVVALEDRFEVCFDPDDDEGVRSIDDVVRVLQAKLAERGAADA